MARHGDEASKTFILLVLDHELMQCFSLLVLAVAALVAQGFVHKPVVGNFQNPLL